MKKQKLIVIVGPTASGKTSAAIEVAKEFNGEIICADSRTIYREMNIGTAKPKYDKDNNIETNKSEILSLFLDKPIMVEGVAHWGFDLVNPDESFTVADFKTYADSKIKEIIKREKLPILVGGTGLYVSAVVDNLSFSEVPPNFTLRHELENNDNSELLERIRVIDPETAETIDSSNRRRLLRAVEIVETTGEPISKQQIKGKSKYDILIIGMDIERDILYERIEDRVDAMIVEGLVDEVRMLRDKYGCEVNSMTGIGYRQICAFLDGYMKLRDAIDLLKRDTRHYAKRQMTWFKRDTRIIWLKDLDQILSSVREFID